MLFSIDYIRIYNKVGSILPIEDLSTINIIEPFLVSHFISVVLFIYMAFIVYSLKTHCI